MFEISVEGPDGSFEVALEQRTIVVGRGSTCEVVLVAKQVSRNHARFEVVDGRVVVTDLGSGNGTHVDGERVAGSMDVPADALVQIEPFSLRVRWSEGAAEPETSQPRTFVCPDRLWTDLESWARERGESVDVVLVEALTRGARTRGAAEHASAQRTDGPRGSLATLPGADAGRPSPAGPPPLPNLSGSGGPGAGPPPLPGAGRPTPVPGPAPARAPARPPGARPPAPPRLPVRAERPAPEAAPSVLDRVVSRPRAAPASGDAVDCSVFAPPIAPIGGSFLVQVALHGPEHVTAAAPGGEGSTLQLDVPRMAPLVLTLTLPPGLFAEEPVRVVRWQGRAELLRFVVTPQAGLGPGPVGAKVTVCVGDAPVGHVVFKIDLAPAPAGQGTEPVCTGSPSRYGRVFLSYESVDRPEAAKRLQSLRQCGVEVHGASLDLEPPQRWERGLYGEIDRCDLLLLFWSTTASKSEWVMREVWHALQRKGENALAPPEIVPVILEGPPVPTPAHWMAHLRFDERMVVAMQIRGGG